MSELLSGFIGALCVFLLGVVGNAWRRRRERIALMSLVHMEIMHNELISDRIADEGTQVPGNPGLTYPIYTGEMGALHDDAWRENRAHISQLEAERAVEYLGMYYTSIATLISENRLYQEIKDYTSDTDVNKIFEGIHNNLGPLARYACERQTGVVRVWSNGMLVVAGKWQPEPNVESTWNRRNLSPASDDEPNDHDS